MNNEYLLVEHLHENYPGVTLVRLNRPKVLNALNIVVIKELWETLKELDGNEKVNCVVLTGSERAFSAGADIDEMANTTAVEQVRGHNFTHWGMLNFFKKPLIACVDGYCLGGGLELAMTCDLMIVSESAQLGQPEINIGTMPGAGGTQRLTKALGKSKAMYYVLTGEHFSGVQAYQWGLAAKVLPSEVLLESTLKMAHNISQKSQVATTLAKDSVNKSFELNLKGGLEYEQKNFFLTFSSLDQKEGMKAFVEKRPPNFTGQ